MSDDISTALSLLVVGMITVFIVLLFVVIGGNLLIKIVNKFAPEVSRTSPKREERNNISPAKIAAIKSAIDQLTGGKGEVISIEKVN
ncbi:MAG: OadG family protein [Cyclobacteriaceae bacterium]|jgi:oxaloacetate decarboxylase (Na+ extruding) subunit gamma|nr:OadG family protein [Cyclobacteriaceae bacterium]